MISPLPHWFASRTLIGNRPSVPSSSSSSCSVLLMTLWCAGMLKVLLRMDFLRFTREYMSIFSWKRRALLPTPAFTFTPPAGGAFQILGCVSLCSPPRFLRSTCEAAPPHGSAWCCWCCPSPGEQPRQCCAHIKQHGMRNKGTTLSKVLSFQSSDTKMFSSHTTSQTLNQ